VGCCPQRAVAHRWLWRRTSSTSSIWRCSPRRTHLGSGLIHGLITDRPAVRVSSSSASSWPCVDGALTLPRSHRNAADPAGQACDHFGLSRLVRNLQHGRLSGSGPTGGHASIFEATGHWFSDQQGRREKARHPAATGCLCRLWSKARDSSLRPMVVRLSSSRKAGSPCAFPGLLRASAPSRRPLGTTTSLLVRNLRYGRLRCGVLPSGMVYWRCGKAKPDRQARGTRRQPSAFVASGSPVAHERGGIHLFCQRWRGFPSSRGAVERSSP
jgi:hypothetical protein